MLCSAIPGALSKARKGDNSCLVLEGVGCRGMVTNNPAQRLLKGGVKNFRDLNGGINNGKMYLLVLEASQV